MSQRQGHDAPGIQISTTKDRPVPDPIYLASVYRLTAVNFWESAKILSASFESKPESPPTKLTAIPFYFLISHAAELLLKSALLKRGFGEGDLKKFDYRHNLGALLNELLARGGAVSDDTSAVIAGLDKQHQTHALRYTALVDDGQKTYMPPPVLAFSTLQELLMLTRAPRPAVAIGSGMVH